MYVNQMHPKPLILMRDAIINICQLVCWLHEHVSSSPGEEYHTDFCKEKTVKHSGAAAALCPASPAHALPPSRRNQGQHLQ